MAMAEVRLTMRPDETVKVHESDLPQLAHQGLIEGEPVLLPDTPPEPPASTPADSPAGPPAAKPQTAKAPRRAAANEGTSNP
jgi:hypothetical protein